MAEEKPEEPVPGATAADVRLSRMVEFKVHFV